MIFHARMVSDTGRIRVNKCCICDSDPQTQTRLPRSQKRSAFLTTDRLSDIPGKKFTLDEFKTMILTSVNDMETYLDGSKTGLVLADYRKKMGTGSIDAYQLLMQVEGTPCLRAKVGTKQLVALTKYFGGSASNLTYLRVEMTRENMDKLGITEAPSISYGKLMIHCTKPGVAKISVTAIAGGGSVGGGSSMGGQEITKEFAVIARATENANGGWL